VHHFARDREKLAILERKSAPTSRRRFRRRRWKTTQRTSQTTARLRPRSQTMNATDAEYRAIYNVVSPFDEKYSFQNTGFSQS